MSVLQRTSRRYQTGATSLLLRQFAAITVAGVFQDLCRWNDLMYEAHKKVMEKLRKQACDLLGAEGVLVNLDDWMGDSGARQLRLERQCGFEQQEAWLAFNDGRRGHYVYVGLELFRWEVCEPAIRLVRVSVPPLPRMEDFWVVAREDVVRFYRQYRRTHRNRQPAQAPLMEPRLRQALLDNTIGLLTRGREILQKYGVAMKRGVLLLGLPGNGKTMACRWVADQCRRRGLDWRTVSGAEFDEARNAKELRKLFKLSRPGIVMFDDFDRALQDRQKFGENKTHNTFLTELDGFRPKRGIVYMFATNLELHQLDPAIRRPGRIDVVIEFPKPNAILRRQLVELTWQSEIVEAIGLQRIVRETNELSFAEIEELRTQLVFHFWDHERWDWQAAMSKLRARSEVTTNPRPIGFGLRVGQMDQVPTVSGLGKGDRD